MHYAVVGRILAELPWDRYALSGAQGYLRLYNGTLPLGRGIQVGPIPIEIDLEKEFAGFGEHYLAREPLDQEGAFEIGIDDRQHPYASGSLRAVLELPFVRPSDGNADKHVSRFLVLETFEPAWHFEGKTATTTWNFQVNAQFWTLAFGEKADPILRNVS